MNFGLLEALEQLEKEKGISKEEVLQILEKALLNAYKKHLGVQKGTDLSNIVVEIDRQTGNIHIYHVLEVVEEVEDPIHQISLEEARKHDSKAEIGSQIKVEVNPKKFGRIAAQTAKQVLIQQIRELEKQKLYEQYSDFEGTVRTSEVIRVTKDWADIRIGKIETRLLRREWIPGETIKAGDMIKVYITKVEQTRKGPRIYVSRRVPEFVAGLLRLEVPEIEEGIVEIKAIAREAGVRTKVAVISHELNVDPVGACIGEGKMRINAVMRELKGEKVDILKWSDDPKELIANALAPAPVTEVDILDPNNKVARVLVPPNHMPLAIGKDGQNVRLAVKLTGWKIDIKPVLNA